MTAISFHMEGERVVGFQVSGHSGYAEEGQDIVCAAVSAAVGLVECTVNTVLGLAADMKIDSGNAAFSLRLPGGLSETDEATCQNLLVALMVWLTDLQAEYPDYISVMEV